MHEESISFEIKLGMQLPPCQENTEKERGDYMEIKKKKWEKQDRIREQNCVPCVSCLKILYQQTEKSENQSFNRQEFEITSFCMVNKWNNKGKHPQ